MRQLRSIAGLALVGYGLLVTTGVLAHESHLAALGSLLSGAALLSTGRLPTVPSARATLVAAVGLTAVGGVFLFNLITGSGFILPEWGIVAYGLGLLIAAPNLDRPIGSVDVGTLVGWSFPLLLGPLVLFSVNATLAQPLGPRTSSVAGPAIEHLLVAPTAFVLDVLGTSASRHGANLVLDAEGSRVLGVGLVCAGIYPTILFAGLLGLFVWERRPPPRRAALFLGVGVLGLYLVNILRLVVLALVGQRWGFEVLAPVHAHAGWILYALFALAFWVLLVPWLDGAEASPA